MTAELPAGNELRTGTALAPGHGQRRPDTSGVLIRGLAEDDVPVVERLCGESLDLPEDAAEAAVIVRRLRSVQPGRRAVGLVASDGTAVVGVVLASLNHADPTIGHIDLVAVLPAMRRRGIGRSLLLAAEVALDAAGAREVLIAGNLPYAWPGIDVRYTPAVCMALALGYEHDRTGWNMTVDLSAQETLESLDTAPAEERLAAAGVTVRRTTTADMPALAEFITSHFSTGWLWEVEQSIGRDGAGCHMAVREDGTVLGFAAYGALRPTFFGPTGTAPQARGSGIGAVLLRRCLADQRASGHPRAQIGWVGPVPFYARTVGAYIERVFFLYRKRLDVSA